MGPLCPRLSLPSRRLMSGRHNNVERRVGGSETKSFGAADKSAESVGRSAAAHHPCGLVLALAAERLDGLADVRQSEGVLRVDGLVDAPEAGGVGGRGVGGARESEDGESDDGPDGENALHWTFPSVGGCVFTRHHVLLIAAQFWMHFVTKSQPGVRVSCGASDPATAYSPATAATASRWRRVALIARRVCSFGPTCATSSARGIS